MDLECSFTEEPADEEIVQADLVVRLENSSEPVTPPRHTRGSNTLRSYLTTSSAKRKLKKAFHCKFCNETLLGQDLFYHLKETRKCRTCYQKVHRICSFELLVQKIFSCQVCYETKRVDFRKHLVKNRACLEEYRKITNKQSAEEISKMIIAQNRSLLPSRRRTVRASKYKAKREEEQENKSKVKSLNEYRLSVMFSNYKKCVVCTSNFTEYGARVILEQEDLFEKLQLDSDLHGASRRFEKYHICSYCDAESDKSRDVDGSKKSSSRLAEILSEDKMLFFPHNDAVVQPVPEHVIETDIRLMVPVNCNSVSDNPAVCKIGRSHDLAKIYENGNITRSVISSVYENELNKYRQIKMYGSMFKAIVKNFSTKTISSVVQIQDSSRVSCSSDWFNHQRQSIKFKIDQFGAIFLVVQIDLPETCEEIKATCMLQEGIVVTVDQQMLSTGEVELSYSIHWDHGSDSNCNELCLHKLDIDAYLDNINFDEKKLRSRYLGTYLSSVHQKLESFVKHILLARSCGLFSENYHIMLAFDKMGKASLVGCLWPKALDEFNQVVADNNGDIKVDGALIEFVERNISASCDPRLLRSTFNLSPLESKRLAALVLEKQFNDDDIERASYTELPSLETIVKRRCSERNLKESRALKSKMANLLINLSLQDIKKLSTLDWLEHVWSDVTGEISEDGTLVKIMFEEEQQEFTFEIDDRLSFYLADYDDSSPLTGIYHYALSCSEGIEETKVVMKRLFLIDSFIKPFNDLFLKAANSSITIEIVDSSKKIQKLMSREVTQFPEEINPQLVFSHEIVSLVEAVSLFDERKKRFRSSTVDQWVNPKPNRKLTVKKVQEYSEDNFTIEGSHELFQIVPDNIIKHFSRIGCEGLILAETACWYDTCDAEKSKELFELYDESEVPKSEVECVHIEGSLPEYILCRTGQVLKKRKRMKVMILPEPNSDYEKMYSRCMLFLPLKSESELIDAPRKKYEEYEDVINRNEKKMFPKKILKRRVLVTEHDDTEDEVVDSGNEDSSMENSIDYGEAALDVLLEILEEDE